MAFQIGDVVILNSHKGSYKPVIMTVTMLLPDDTCQVAWFDEVEKEHFVTFPKKALSSAKDLL